MFKLRALVVIIIALVSLANLTLAGSECVETGYTVVTINGVLTDEKGASKNANALSDYLGDTYNNEPIQIKYLLNKTHLAGVGDLLKAAYQKFFEYETVDDYDLREMINAASEKVTTQKVLLVAHSQGNFYANSFYDVVAGKAGGVPARSIGVYSVASPSGRVAGEGKWLTSDTDEIIAGLVSRFPSRNILKPNTHILLPTNDVSHGHSFSDVYLRYRGAEIVSDIYAALDKLQPNTVQNGKRCIDPPSLGILHTAKGAAFFVADPIANVSRTVATGTIKGVYQTGMLVTETGAKVGNAIAALGRGVIGSVATTAGVVKESFTASNTVQSSVAIVSNFGDRSETSDEESTPEESTLTEEPSPISVQTVAGDNNETEISADTSEQPQSVVEDTAPIVEAPIVTSSTPSASPSSPPLTTPVSAPPGFGGGAPPPTVQNTESAPPVDEEEQETEPTELTEADTTPPEAPAITYPASNHIFTSSAVELRGQAEANAIIVYGDIASTTVSDSGEWILALTLLDGAHTISLFATDAAGNISASSSVSFSVDTEGPAFTAEISECKKSISSEECVLVDNTVTVVAKTDAVDAEYFIFKTGDRYATSTGMTSFVLNTGDFSIEVSARDVSGNHSATTTLEAAIVSQPVVINEIAWMGTQAETGDEWIELYNPTPYEIDVSSFVFYSSDESPYVQLSGTIEPNGYYLIERKNSGEEDEATESPVVDVAAGTWASFGAGLNNNGEVLSLVYMSGLGTTTIDTVPLCSDQWCGGENTTSSKRFSMERYDPLQESDDPLNWGDAIGEFIINGTDVKGLPIRGTPGKRNSVQYLLPNLNSGESAVMSAEESPYFVPRIGYTVPAGATLTIEPGVVIKFDPLRQAKFIIRGSLQALGSAENPIIFTSLFDDEHGGDIHAGECLRDPCPGRGDWNQIIWEDASSPSAVSHTIFLYGGFVRNQSSIYGAVAVQNSTVTFDNVVVEESDRQGIYLKNATAAITNSVFKNNDEGGVYSAFSTTTVQHSLFEGNGEYGILITESPGYVVQDNVFVDNEKGETSITNSVDLTLPGDTATEEVEED